MTKSWRAWLIAMIAAASLAACGQTTRTVVPVETAPEARSPLLAIRLLEWAFAHRDLDAIDGLLTADLELVSASLDSAGNPTRLPRDRAWVMDALRSLFEGVPGQHPPAEVRLALDRNLIAFPDPRPGKSHVHHRTIRTSMDFIVMDPSTTNVQEATGSLLFYLVRGDAAAIPPGSLGDPGASDSTRWWVERIDDETIGAEGAPQLGASPSRSITFGGILAYYRSRLVPEGLNLMSSNLPLRLAVLAALVLASCAQPVRVLQPRPEAPTPTTPSGAVRSFEWAVNHSQTDLLARHLVLDFELVTAGLDSAGNPAREALDRVKVLDGFRSMFEGVPDRFEPADVSMHLDTHLFAVPDPDPALDPRLHQAIGSSLELRVYDPTDGVLREISARLIFHLVRGDAAATVGSPPDSTQWWIDGIEDEWIGPVGTPRSGANPASKLTLAGLLEYYRLRLRR